MSKKQNTMMGKIALLGVFVVMISSFAVAFGVSSPYWDERALVMYPGESKVVSLELQNMAGGEDLSFQAELTEGSEIATLTGKSVYKVPLGERKNVEVEVSIPEDTVIGSSYTVGLRFTQVSDGDGGMVKMTGAIGKSFPVQVGEEPEVPEAPAPEPSGFSPLMIAIIIAIAVAIVYFAIRKRG